MRAFNVDKDLSNNYVISWNHQEFEVPYHCLSEEIKIGTHLTHLDVVDIQRHALIYARRHALV